MRLNELAAVGGFKPRFQKRDAASVDIMRWVWVAIYFRCPNWFWLCSGSVAMVVLLEFSPWLHNSSIGPT
jgi:hypothetical protein